MRVAVIALVVGCLGHPAFADNKAEAHYKQGRAYEKAKAYDQAIAEFQAAYELDKNPGHLFNIGVDYEAKGELKTALDFYQRYLTDEPKGRYADQARDNITKGTQKLLDEEAKRKADEARIAAEQKKLKDEQDAIAKKAKDEQDAASKKTAVLAHQKQATAYAQAGAWAKAGEEHRAAATVDGDPQHLLDAADAFAKQPDNVQAREALLAYLEKVPVGATSDNIRIRVAELTKAIEKADAERQRVEQAERQRVAALQLVGTAPQGPKRHPTFGFELRAGYMATSSFVTQQPFMEVTVKDGTAVDIGAFLDLPLLAAWHARLGLRGRYFTSTFNTNECGSIAMCPSKISARYVGPTLTIEQSVVHTKRFDLFGIAGFYAALNAGDGKISFFQGASDQPLKLAIQLAPELGIGARYGPVTIQFLFHVSITKFNNEDLGADRIDVGHATGLLLAASWALPR